jgi:hypothetical protein
MRLEFCDENANCCLLGLLISVQQGLTDNGIPSHIIMIALPRITYSGASCQHPYHSYRPHIRSTANEYVPR